jgi:peptide methionine sulfoxide reductase MsrA
LALTWMAKTGKLAWTKCSEQRNSCLTSSALTSADPYASAGERHLHYYARKHQQYLAKNPYGYRCHANTGVKFPKTA